MQSVKIKTRKEMMMRTKKMATLFFIAIMIAR